jgi:hypothetical protein
MLASNLAAYGIDYGGELDGLAEDPERYWSERSRLAWN